MLHHRLVGRVQSKERYFIFKYDFLAFVLVVVAFIKNWGFIIFVSVFISFPDDVRNFHRRIFINQSETEIADKKMSVELYDDHNTISLSRHEKVCLRRLRFERYFSHHWAT